jgi:hypothetical protein
MARKSATGFDAQGQRIINVAAPTATSDAVPKSFVRYDLMASCVDKPLAGEVIGSWVIPAAMTLPTSLTGTQAVASTAAAASAVWALVRRPAGSNVETAIATLTFAANGTIATLSSQTSVPLAAGDRLRLKAPATQDAALADIDFCIPLTR